MRTEEKCVENGVLKVSLYIDGAELASARKRTYESCADSYPVPNKASGLAELSDLERIYGPAVLFDEALSLAVPECFEAFISGQGLRIVGKPQVSDVRFIEGGVRFTVCADLYPEVETGEYLGIAVPFSRRERQAEFERAVIERACAQMKGEIPAHLIEKKLDALTAQQKVSINNDSVYHLLADMLVILGEAYREAGVVRPKVQVRREATDLMLQTASEENERDWRGFLFSQLRDMTERYHSLPEDFDARLEKILQRRRSKKEKLTAEEMTEELFSAYLGSLELTQEQWRNQQRARAARDVCLDLLLDSAAEREHISVEPPEIREALEAIAAQYGLEPEEAQAGISLEALVWKLRREKALALILNSAITDEKGRARLDAEREKAAGEAQKAAQITL